jgi:hypothetical protein
MARATGDMLFCERVPVTRGYSDAWFEAKPTTELSESPESQLNARWDSKLVPSRSMKYAARASLCATALIATTRSFFT